MPARIRVKVKPRSASDAITGCESGLLSVSVRALPDGGAANTAVEKLIAHEFGVPKTSVSVVRGHTAREKTVEITSLTVAEVARILDRYSTG